MKCDPPQPSSPRPRHHGHGICQNLEAGMVSRFEWITRNGDRELQQHGAWIHGVWCFMRFRWAIVRRIIDGTNWSSRHSAEQLSAGLMMVICTEVGLIDAVTLRRDLRPLQLLVVSATYLCWRVWKVWRLGEETFHWPRWWRAWWLGWSAETSPTLGTCHLWACVG